MVVFVLSAVDPRMTIHHSGVLEGQGNCGRICDHFWAGELLAMAASARDGGQFRLM